ncbi:hypothetical protein JW968_00930 [Candidatus Woesearchaeota archaeon]|nr:hypothetical protein [Candidatus Woesearchaeota archaeon]
MQKARILNTRETKQIMKKIEEQWGFRGDLRYTFIQNERDKIFVITNDLKLLEKPEDLRIDSLGLYFGEFKNNELRLSIEGSQMIGPGATHDVIDLTRAQMIQWFKGDDIEMDIGGEPRYVIMRHEKDFLGTGRYKEGKILNFVPKARRLDYKYAED